MINALLAFAAIGAYTNIVTYTGKVKDGVVILPADANLPEGTDVKVEPLDLLPETDPSIEAILKLARPRPHWPKDFALNHAHYVKGHPKKT